jgi:hypothetical protein
MGGEEITPEYYRAHVPPGMNTVAFGVDGDRYTREHYDALGPLARLGWVEIRARELAGFRVFRTTGRIDPNARAQLSDKR